MSKLLFKLREQLVETSSTVTLSYSGSPSRRKRRRHDAVDKLVVRAAESDELQEAAVLFLEARAHVNFTGAANSHLYRSVLLRLDESVDSITPDMAYRLYERLEPLLETASSEPCASQSDHGKFLKALSKEFDVEILSTTPINDGVFVHLDRDESTALADEVNRVRSFALSHKYLILRKGTFSSDDDHVWVFVNVPNVNAEVGTITTKW